MTNTRQMFRALALGAAMAMPALLTTSIAVPASAQVNVSISFDNFHNRLAPYGTWSNHPRWGEVWHPTRVERDFRPYYNGHWVNTREYGWFWVSEDSWGDVPYHYGRWVFDPRDGWLWVPGYVWAPSWVVWRSGGGNIGWFPMPPGDNYYGDGPYRDNFDNQYGYRDWYGPSFGSDQFLSLWIFVGLDHFGDRDYRNYALPQRDYGRFISQTTNTTNYVTINNYVVNRSIDVNRLPRETSQRFQPVAASTVIGRDAVVTQAATGREVEQRERQRHPIPVNINPAEQRGNLSPPAVQQNTNRAPQALGGSGGDRAPATVQPSPQTGRGAAPSTATPSGPATGTSRQNDRGQANISPAEQRGRASPQQPNANQAPQGSGGRTGDRAAPVTNAPPAPPPTTSAAPQGPAEPRNRGQVNPQTERGIQSPQSPQARGTPAQKDNAVVQDSRTPPRVQGNVPAATSPAAAVGQGNARNNQARGNKPGDTKNVDDPKAADEKKSGADRGRN